MLEALSQSNDPPLPSALLKSPSHASSMETFGAVHGLSSDEVSAQSCTNSSQFGVLPAQTRSCVCWSYYYISESFLNLLCQWFVLTSDGMVLIPHRRTLLVEIFVQRHIKEIMHFRDYY